MIKRTIERVRNACSWILNPTCLIDRWLDQIEKLGPVLAVPVRSAGLSHNSEARIKARLD